MRREGDSRRNTSSPSKLCLVRSPDHSIQYTYWENDTGALCLSLSKLNGQKKTELHKMSLS